MPALIRHRTGPLATHHVPADDPAFAFALSLAIHCGPFIVGHKYSDDALCYWEVNNTYCDFDPRGGMPEPMSFKDFIGANLPAVSLVGEEDDGDMEAWETYRAEVIERWKTQGKSPVEVQV